MLGPRSQLLVSLASEALAPSELVHDFAGRISTELSEMLRTRNGFYAFESALHLFPSGATSAPGGSLEVWNAPDGWRTEYHGLADGYLFFAEDVFGIQFAIRDELIYTFDPETADVAVVATSVEDWADQFLANYELLSGFPIARKWQESNGAIKAGQRLIPRIPFVLGGEFEPSNLYALDAAEGMRVRAELALQIRDLPDGSKVRYRIVE